MAWLSRMERLHLMSRRCLSTSHRFLSDEVLFEVRNKAGVIMLNRSKALNALNLNMIRLIYPVIKEWEIDPNIQVIIMKGAGEKAFCAGGDVRAIAEGGPRNELSKTFFKEEYNLNNAIGCLSTPFIAMINGITMGGGVGLSVHGRFRVASDKTLFAMPEAGIGLFPDVGGGYFLPRLKGALGLFLALTGHRLKGRDVFFAGVASHFVSSKEIPYLEEEILQIPSPDANNLKQVLYTYHDKCDELKSQFSLCDHLDSIDRVFSKDSLEDIFDALTEEDTEWSKKQLQILQKMSPVSMKVLLRQLQRGACLSLSETLQMEYRISQRFMENKDFFEGIRAVLIDRDNAPTWQHSSIREVSDETVESYFKLLPTDRELIFD